MPLDGCFQMEANTKQRPLNVERRTLNAERSCQGTVKISFP
jgi:hypothetical protein